MVQTIHQICDIQCVRQVLPCDNGMQIVFPTGGAVRLYTGHPDYQHILQQARNSLEYGSPVAFIANEAGELADLNYTHQSSVRRVRINEDDSNRLMIEFWSYSPICYLTKDHPEFER